MMQFSREINRLLLGVLVIFSLVAVSAAYWSIVGADTILQRPDNPRRVEDETSIQRGSIFDRNGTILVESTKNDQDILIRQYLYPEMHSALGYFSQRYGVGGAEAAYDPILRGDDLANDWSNYFSQELLNRPQEGSDVRLTFDLATQQTLAEAMDGHQGAAVVLAVPSGEVLAMVSLPTFDPNQLDAQWEELSQAVGKPFFNRVLQGNYQPGGNLQTPLVAAAILSGESLDTPIENANRSIDLDNIQIQCAVVLPPQTLTLREAYTFGCAYPFAQLGNTLGVETVQAAYNTFGLGTLPTLPGFVTAPPTQATVTPEVRIIDGSNLTDNALGQAQLTVNPLEMAMMAAAIVNDGNAPQAYTLLEVQQPESQFWTKSDIHAASLPFMTANTARQLQDMMRLAVAEGASQNAARPNIDIGGHAALAYSGEEVQAWFVGFTTLGGRRGIAIAIVLENSDDPGLAADIGGTVLAAAHQQFQEDNGS
jgi:peptidoglycan glycosyltransferase